MSGRAKRSRRSGKLASASVSSAAGPGRHFVSRAAAGVDEVDIMLARMLVCPRCGAERAQPCKTLDGTKAICRERIDALEDLDKYEREVEVPRARRR